MPTIVRIESHNFAAPLVNEDFEESIGNVDRAAKRIDPSCQSWFLEKVICVITHHIMMVFFTHGGAHKVVYGINWRVSRSFEEFRRWKGLDIRVSKFDVVHSKKK